MGKVFKPIFVLAGFFMLSLSSHAQAAGQYGEQSPIIYITENVYEQPDIIAVFNNTHTGYFRDPKAPRFIFIDQKGRWGLGVGGYVQTKAEYDFGGIVDNVDFLPSYISTGGQASSRYQMYASTSLLWRFHRLHSGNMAWRRQDLQTSQCLHAVQVCNDRLQHG